MEDVIVEEGLRGTGVGHALMQAVLAHPLVAQAEEVELYCDPARERFYTDAGFMTVTDQILMRINHQHS